MSHKSYVRTHGKRRIASLCPSPSPKPAAQPRADKVKGYSHKEEPNPDSPSQLERGDVREMDLRIVIGLRVAIDDAIFAIAQRFNLRYHVLRAQFGVDGAVYKIGLEVKERTTRTTVYRTGTAPIIPTDGPGKPLGSARLPRARATAV